MTLADAWAEFRVAVVALTAKILRVDLWVDDDNSFNQEPNPFVSEIEANLIHRSLDATMGCTWPVALADFDAARATVKMVLTYLSSTMDVPAAAIAFELARLYPAFYDTETDITVFAGADIFSDVEAGPGQISIREEIHSFIAESLESGPDAAVRVVQTFYERWPDPDIAGIYCSELLAHLLTALVHRSAFDAVAESADEAG